MTEMEVSATYECSRCPLIFDDLNHLMHGRRYKEEEEEKGDARGRVATSKLPNSHRWASFLPQISHVMKTIPTKKSTNLIKDRESLTCYFTNYLGSIYQYMYIKGPIA